MVIKINVVIITTDEYLALFEYISEYNFQYGTH